MARQGRAARGEGSLVPSALRGRFPDERRSIARWARAGLLGLSVLLAGLALGACGASTVSVSTPKSTPELIPPSDTSAEAAAIQTTATSTTATSTSTNTTSTPESSSGSSSSGESSSGGSSEPSSSGAGSSGSGAGGGTPAAEKEKEAPKTEAKGGTEAGGSSPTGGASAP